MIDLSIVIPTCQRGALLADCLHSIEQAAHCSYELIVVDGASTDDTAAVLGRAKEVMGDRLRVIREETREGFTKAVNKGFRVATGRFVAWLNDDARPLPGCFDEAVQQMAAAKADVGLLALFHAWHTARNVAYETYVAGKPYRLLHVRGTLYANFGLGRRETFSSLDYFDERYYFNGCNPDFSLKVWNAGMKVQPAYLTAIDHDEHVDQRRHENAGRSKEDNELLLAKWDLPEKDLTHNAFDPYHPRTLRGRRDQPSIAV